MSEILSQRVLPQGNLILPNTNTYVHATGCFLVEVAQAVGLSVEDALNKLQAVGGFNENGEIIWAKIAEAFPGFTATYVAPYNNEAVLQNLTEGNIVLVEVSAAPIGGTGLHCVTYVGDGKCLDPWVGQEVPTSNYPDVKAYVIITKPSTEPVVTEAAAPETPAQPVGESLPQGLNTYGLDVTNKESMQVVLDTWNAVAHEGKYVTADEYVKFTNTVCEHLGIDTSSDLNKVVETIDTLKRDFATAAQASVVPAPQQVEAVAPAPQAPITAQALPQDQKENIVQHVTDQLKAFLGL